MFQAQVKGCGDRTPEGYGNNGKNICFGLIFQLLKYTVKTLLSLNLQP